MTTLERQAKHTGETGELPAQQVQQLRSVVGGHVLQMVHRGQQRGQPALGLVRFSAGVLPASPYLASSATRRGSTTARSSSPKHRPASSETGSAP